MNEARIQGQMIGAALGSNSLSDQCAKAVRVNTIGEEIDQRINRCQGQLEKLQLVKKKFADGRALEVTTSELSEALNRGY